MLLGIGPAGPVAGRRGVTPEALADTPPRNAVRLCGLERPGAQD